MFRWVRISYIETDDLLTCYLSEDQLNILGIANDLKQLFIQIGSVKLKLNRITNDKFNLDSRRLYLSSDVEDHLLISEGITFQIKGINKNTIELGPYIGIFINNERISDLDSGKNFSEYTEYEAACRKLQGLCCFFSLECIDWNSNTIRGIYRRGLSWTSGILPLPKIIYNRNVENNCLLESLTLKMKLGDGYQILNTTPKLSKWETANALRKRPGIEVHIPETAAYMSPKDIDKLLKKYTSVYLKPNLLSKGRGIFKVSKLGSGYRLEYRTGEANHAASLENIEDIDKALNRFTKEGGGYIVQQEIQKACYRGNPFDLRVLCQKDFQGSWKVSGIAGRIAGPGSIITSPRSGGSVEGLPTILEDIFEGPCEATRKLQDKVVKLGKEICHAIEADFGNCVELGLDLAIDVFGRIWIVEVNGKPLRVSLKRLGDPELLSLCCRRPIQYLVYLSGFESGQ